MSAQIDIDGQAARQRTGGSPDGELARLVTALLETPQSKLDLPPRLMKLYLQSRWPSRRSMLIAWLLAMAGLNAVCAVFDPFIVKTPEIWLFLCGRIAVCGMFAMSAAIVHRMETTGFEGPVVIACCLMMSAVAGVGGLAVDPGFMLRGLEQATFAGAVAIIVARIRWRDTIVLAITLVISLALFVSIAPGLPIAEKAQTVLIYGLGVVGLVFVRRAQNRYLYRLFLTNLRERLKIDAVEGMNGRLAALARTDPLTGLANRRHFDEMLGALQASASASEAPTALFMIDIDCFKRLNDDFGHAAGDECLRIVAGLIRGELRVGQDFLARFGGEEFVAVLPGVTKDEARVAADRVRRAIAARRVANPRSPHGVVTVSVGVAVSPPGDLLLLVAEADAALYEAKALGRNRIRVARGERPSRVA